MESYWSLLKRARHDTYISVEPLHLFRYLDEQAFRFNNTALNNSYLSLPGSSNLNITGDLTLAAWVNPDAITGQHTHVMAAHAPG